MSCRRKGFLIRSVTRFSHVLNATQEAHGEGSDGTANLQEVSEEILSSECPYPELSAFLIHAFHALSQKYQERLRSVEQRLEGLDRYK